MSQAWPLVPIRTVYDGLFDGPHATPKPSEEGAIFLGIGNITEDGHLNLFQTKRISEEDFPKWTKRVLPKPGDIVFTYEATLNRYAIIPKGFRGCLGRRLALIRPNPEVVDTRWLHYYFFSTEWRAVVAANTLSGATVDRIPLSGFPDFPIRLPDLSTQRRIASILSAYDDLIENNNRRIAILEEMARRIYEEWFVHFRFPGYEQVKMVESELGLIPEGWSVCRLDDVLVLQRGFDLPRQDRAEGSFPIISASGQSGTHKEFRVRGPGVVTGRSGSLGTVMYVESDFWPLNTTLWVKEFKVGSAIYSFYVLKSIDLAGFNSGAAVPTLNRNDVHGLPVLKPMPEVLTQFDKTVGPMLALKRRLEKKNDNLRATRDLLLPKLISGELDVSNLPTPEEASAA